MSVKLMSAVFEADFPPSEKLLLLAMADFANDEGKSIYPSQETLARKTGLSDRTVRTLTKKLIAAEVIKTVGKTNAGTYQYEIRPETISTRKPLPPETTSGVDRKPLPVTPETTSYDPLVNHQLTISTKRTPKTRTVSAKNPKPERPRDELFDVIAEVTQTDPATAGSTIAKVKVVLAKAGYTPDDVRAFAKKWWEWKDRTTSPSVWQLQEKIGNVKRPKKFYPNPNSPDFRRRPKPTILP